MDKITKALKKLNNKEKQVIESVLHDIKNGLTSEYDIKKLKNKDNIFRIRKGGLRIIYLIDKKDGIKILTIEKRSENTYRF